MGRQRPARLICRHRTKLVEWPEKVGALLPRPDWDIQLQPVDDSARQARIEAHSARGMHLLQSLEPQI